MEYQDFISLRSAKDDPDIGRFIRNRNALYWQIRRRTDNGLADTKAVFKGPDGEWWVNKSRYLAWFVGEEPQDVSTS